MTRKEVQAIIDEVDENGDGKLDYKEVGTTLYSVSHTDVAIPIPDHLYSLLPHAASDPDSCILTSAFTVTLFEILESSFVHVK